MSAARGGSSVKYMNEEGSIPTVRIFGAGYGPWIPKRLEDYKKLNLTYNPLTLKWDDPIQIEDSKGNMIDMPTVLAYNATKEMKRANRRLQITFLTTGNEDITAATKKDKN